LQAQPLNLLKFASPLAQGLRIARSIAGFTAAMRAASLRFVAAKYAEFDVFEQRLRPASQGKIPSREHQRCVVP
jgi:hypothetical protein